MKSLLLSLYVAVFGAFVIVNPVSAESIPLWQKTSAPEIGWQSIASSADGTRLLAVNSSAAQPVYLSTNSGATWTTSSNFLVTPYSYARHAAASSADGKTLAVLGFRTINISTDFGATWTERKTIEDPFRWTAVALSADGTKMVAVNQMQSTSGGEIYTSTDSGTNWTSRYSGSAWSDVASSADGTKLVAVVSSVPDGVAIVGKIHVSTNSGIDWANTGYPYDPFEETIPGYLWTGVACSADGTKMFATEITSFGAVNSVYPAGGLLHISTDSGGSWTAMPPAGSWMSIACSTNGNLLVLASSSSDVFGNEQQFTGAIYTSLNAWSSPMTPWQLAYAPNSPWRSLATSADGTKLYAASQDGIYTYSAPSTNPPAMNLASGGGNAFVSWPWPSEGFVLQQNSNLATTNWVTVPGSPSLVNQMIVPQTNNNNFYRVVKP